MDGANTELKGAKNVSLKETILKGGRGEEGDENPLK